METFLGALLGVLGALLVEFVIRRVQERDHREQQEKRNAHLLRLAGNELQGNIEALAALRVQVQVLDQPTAAIRTSVWSAFLDELFEALPLGSTVDSVTSAYESLTRLDRVVDSYAQQLGQGRLAEAAEATVPQLASMLEETAISVERALAALGSR